MKMQEVAIKTQETLPKNVRRNHGSYEFRKTIRGTVISITCKDLDTLLEQAEKEIANITGGIEHKKQTLTYADWFDEWFDKVKKEQVKSTSRQTMKRLSNRTFKKYLGYMLVKDIFPADIQDAVNSMVSDGIAPSQIRRALSNFNQCMAYAKANRYIDSNPVTQIVVPWAYKKEEEEIPLTVEEQDELLDFIDNESNWYRELIYVMLLTGLRIGEVGALQWDNIDFKNNMIKVRNNLTVSYLDGKKTMMLGTVKTPASIREIPMMGEAKEMLLTQKNKVEQLKEELGDRWRTPGELGDLVFVTTMGSPCTRYIVEKELRKIVERMNFGRDEMAKYRKIHPHLLRHSFCTRCFENGIEKKVVQKWAGHANYSVTETIYTHVLARIHEKESKKLPSAHSKKQCYQEIEENLGKESLPVITAHSHT